MAIPVLLVLCAAIGGPYACLGLQHYLLFGHVNVATQAVLLFLCTNFVVCLWELCLCYRYNLIRSTHLKRVKDGEAKTLGIVVFESMSLSDVFSSTFWARIWIDYSRYDDSYSNSGTAGYNIDVGNGHSTLLPTLFLAWSMIYPPTGPKATGIVGIMAYYQMLYGSVVYFFCYFNTGKHTDHSVTEVVAAVLFPTTVWIVFPFMGILASIRLIMEEDFSAWQ